MAKTVNFAAQSVSSFAQAPSAPGAKYGAHRVAKRGAYAYILPIMYETSLAGRIFARNRKSAYFFPPEAFTGGFLNLQALPPCAQLPRAAVRRARPAPSRQQSALPCLRRRGCFARFSARGREVGLYVAGEQRRNLYVEWRHLAAKRLRERKHCGLGCRIEGLEGY